MRLFAKFAGAFLAAFGLTLAITVMAPASPYYLPRTHCRVTDAGFDALEMKKSYADIAKQLGCNGILLNTEDYGRLQIKTYAWRGHRWPYDVIKLGFYNDTLQKTERRIYALNW
ncbi:MAG: hypothetical protein ABL898_05540 [Hyphomicrobiaceae bacterium]